MPGTIDQLKWVYLTEAINELKSPGTFLTQLLFRRRQSVPTETIEVTTLVGDRLVAPFVRPGSEALMVPGLGRQVSTVTAPNIRIKRPFTPNELLFNRRYGTPVFVSAGTQRAAIAEAIALDLQYMRDSIINTIEWMVSQALTGQIAYTVADEESYTITFPKPVGNTVSLLTPDGWNEATGNPKVQFLQAKRIAFNAHGVPITDAIMSQQAAAAFIDNPNVRADLSDTPNIRAGDLDLTANFQDSGAIFLGRFSGIRVWEYSRSLDIDGVETPLIRDNYVEFVSAIPQAENRLYFGAIPDNFNLQGRFFQGEIFSKSWQEEDPPVVIALAHSRPLPVMRRPGTVVSMEVIV